MAGTTSFVLPQNQGDLLALQRQQMFADALMQQAQRPMTADLPNNLAIVPRMGIGNGLVKLAQGLGAGWIQGNALKGQQALVQKQFDQVKGMMSPQDTTVSQDDVDKAALAAGGGPTMAAAAARDNLSPTVGQTRTVPSPLNPTGLPPEQAAMAYMQDAPGWMKDFVAPTNETKNWVQSGQSALRHQLLVSQLAKEGTLNVREGEYVQQPGQPMNFLPKIPENTQPTGPVNPAGPGPSVAGVATIPGALAGAGANAAATAGGTTAGSLAKYQGTGGQELTGPASMFLNPTWLPPAGAAPPMPAPGAASAPPPRPQPAPMPAQGISIADRAGQQGGAEQYMKDRQQVGSIKQANSGLDNAMQLLGQLPATGPRTAGAYDWASIASHIIPGGQQMQFANDAQAYEAIQKYLQNSLFAAAGANPAVTGENSLEAFAHGQPSADRMDLKPLGDAIRYVQSQNDARIAAFGSADKATGGGRNLAAAGPAYSQFVSSYNPKVFEFNRMTPEQKSAFKAGFSAPLPGESPDQTRARVQAFGNSYNQAAAQGWVR